MEGERGEREDGVRGWSEREKEREDGVRGRKRGRSREEGQDHT